MTRELTLATTLIAVSLASAAMAQTAPGAAAAPPKAAPAATPAPPAAPNAPAPAPPNVETPESDVSAEAPPVGAKPETAAPETVAVPAPPPPVPNPAVSAPTAPVRPAPLAPSESIVSAPAPGDSGPTHSPTQRSAEPISSRFELGFNLDAVLYKNRSFDLFSSDDVSRTGGVSIGYAVVDGALALVPELGFSIGSESASNLFGGALSDTELDTAHYYGGVSLRWAALSFLSPEARVSAGASVTKISVTPSSGPGELDEKHVSPFATVGAGITLHTPAGMLETRRGGLRSLILGVTIEGGYAMEKTIALNPTPSHDDGRIPTSDATFGNLERSGAYLRTSFVLRF